MDGSGMINSREIESLDYSYGGGEYGAYLIFGLRDDTLNYRKCDGDDEVVRQIDINRETRDKILTLLEDGDVRSWTDIPENDLIADDEAVIRFEVVFADGLSIKVGGNDKLFPDDEETVQKIVELIENLADGYTEDAGASAQASQTEAESGQELQTDAESGQQLVQDDVQDENSDETEAAGDITAEMILHGDPVRADVFNNGHYFVKIIDRVYFREYGVRALENPTIWGKYLLTPTGDSSYIDYYDEKTGETVRAFEDFGFGNIAYLEPVLFMNGLDFSVSEYGTPYIYAKGRNGEDIELPEIYHGTIKGVSDNNEMLFLESTYVGNDFKPEIAGITGDGRRAFTIESKNHLNYVGTTGDYIIYSENIYDYDGTTAKIWCKNIYEDETVPIMELTCDYGVDINFGELFTLKGKSYIPVIRVAGTAGIFQDGFVIEYMPGVGDSGKTAADFYADEYDDRPRVVIDGVERGFYDLSDDTYYVESKSYESDGDLCRKQKDGSVHLEIANMIPGADYYEIRKDMTLAERVGENGFVMLATHVYDEEGSIGWRDGFRLLKMEYLKTNGDGSFDVLKTVDYE